MRSLGFFGPATNEFESSNMMCLGLFGPATNEFESSNKFGLVWTSDLLNPQYAPTTSVRRSASTWAHTLKLNCVRA